MIIISWCYLGIIHLLIVLYCIEVINSLSLIIALYILNILPVLTILQQEYCPNLFNFLDGNDFYIIQQVQESLVSQVPEPSEFFDILPLDEPFDSQVQYFEDFPLEEPQVKRFDITGTFDGTPSTTIRPKSFIQRWRENILNRPKQFPLDRLAFLKAKYYTCEYSDDSWIQNSHLKQLVTKDDYRPYEEYEDDPHPMKMINNLSSAYIHRRAYLYTERKTTIVDKYKQTTAHRKKRFSMNTILETVSILKKDKDSDDLEKDREQKVKESIPVYMEEEPTSSEETTTTRKPSMWRRISSAFRRRSSSVPSTDDDESSDY